MRLARPLPLDAFALVWSIVWAPAIALAEPEPAAPVRLHLTALPSTIAFIAWLPVHDDRPNAVDLDLKVEVVLPRDCKDEVAGLLTRAGSTDRAPAYDVLIRRDAIGKCEEKAVRRVARHALRVTLPRGATLPLSIGPMTLAVSRAADERGAVAIGGLGPEGELPGAAPTGRPWALARADVTEAAIESVVPGPQGSAIVIARAQVKAPTCATLLDGVLGTGALGVIDHFTPLARLALDEKCDPGKPRAETLRLLLRPGKTADVSFYVGERALTVTRPKAAATPAPTPDAGP